MVFKRVPKKAKESGLAAKVLGELDAKDQIAREAQEAYEAGRAAEEAEDDEAAVQAHAASCDLWEQHHKETDRAVPAEPYERLAMIFRRHHVPDQEVHVINRYMAHAGRQPERRMEARLERAEELLELAELAMADED